MRWAAGVSYDGTGFAGWQTQPAGCGRAPALQDCVEAALTQVAGEPVVSQCAGRTDAGVHAVGQVIHFDTRARRPESAWVRGTRAFLPPGVALRWARPVSGDFEARHSALARTYGYLLFEGREPSPLWRHRATHSSRPLDLERLAGASQPLLGRHDFSAFRSSQCQARTPVRQLTALEWRREGPFVLCRVTADAFLHHMVRNLVGTLLMAGDGRRPVAWPGDVLAAGDRARAAPTLGASGLYLVAIRYDARFGLPPAQFTTSPPALTLAQLA